MRYNVRRARCAGQLMRRVGGHASHVARTETLTNVGPADGVVS